MSVKPVFSRWNDDWLYDMKRRVDNMEPVVASIEALRVQLRITTAAVGKFSEQFEEAQKEPLRRWKRARDTAIVGALSAILSGAFVVVGALLAGGH